MKRALVVIDYTYDFVADDGKLTCGVPGQSIDNRIAELIQEFIDHGDMVVMANDIHYENDVNHPESRLFAPHNIAGTPGREVYGETGKVAKRLTKTNPDQFMWRDKTRFAIWAGTDLWLRLVDELKFDEIHLVGVCTDICVLHSAILAFYKGVRAVIHADGVQSFDPIGHTWTLNHCQNVLGFDVMAGGKKIDVAEYLNILKAGEES